MGEIPNQVACCELVEYPRVKYSDCDVVDPDVGALQQEEAVAHHSEAHVCLRVPSILKFVFVEHYLTVVKDWVVRA